jgi:hypothetical protein
MLLNSWVAAQLTWGSHSNGYEELYLPGNNGSSPLKINGSFGYACHLLSRWFLARLTFRPWRWRRHPKNRLSFDGLHGVISQKLELFQYTHKYAKPYRCSRCVLHIPELRWLYGYQISGTWPLMLLHQPDTLRYGVARLLWQCTAEKLMLLSSPNDIQEEVPVLRPGIVSFCVNTKFYCSWNFKEGITLKVGMKVYSCKGKK